MTTHVANASEKDICARVGVSRKNVTSKKGIPNLKVKVKQVSIDAGKVCLSDNLVKVAFEVAGITQYMQPVIMS